MALHILKLAVGAESVEDLAQWQTARLKEQRKRGVRKPELVHVTRMTPRRKDEILDGGSLYWVIKGQIAVRQSLRDLRAVTQNGIPYCGLVYDNVLVPVQRRVCRPFQGWRYLSDKDAPPDLRIPKGGKGLPEELLAELVSLGLL